MKKLLLIYTLMLLPALSQAQIIKLTCAGCTAPENVIVNNFQTEINQDIPLAAPQRLADGMVDSQTLSAKGMATDYISHFDKIAIGLAAGVGADLEKDTQKDSDLAGIGVTAGFHFGLNISAFTDKEIVGLDPKKLTLLFNFMKLNPTSDFDAASMKSELLSFGAMLSYKLKDGETSRLFGWDGVRVHTGYQYSRADVSFSASLNASDVDSTAVGTISAKDVANFETSTHSIPLEISTGVNFLYVLSFYGGLGTDINFANASVKGNPETQNSNITIGGNARTIGVTTDLDNKGKVQPLFLRGFAGFQVNLPYTRIYVHANNVFGTELYSVATGLRLAF